MAEEKRKVQIEAAVEADTSGLDQIAQAAQEMATEVQQAGQKAGAGLDAIGQGAAPAAQKLDAATSRMAASIQRATASMQAGAKGSADFYEALARSRGVDTAPLQGYIAELRRVEQAQKAVQQAAASSARADSFIAGLKAQADAAGRTRAELLSLQAAEMGLADKAQPYIARLRQMEQGHKALGVSAAQTTAALRQVPMQMTDIVTSLAAGQAPLQVLLQQGGQLKDTFGGIGPAARALGGYILGLVNPFTVAAAAAAGLTYVYLQGAKEMDAYQRALITTGNAAGVTASRLADMAREIASGNGTQSEAAGALADMVKSGAVAADQLKRFTQAALEFERTTGQAVSKTADQFKLLKDAPLDASVKLNTEINHLTVTVYEHIRALELQGRKTDAARVAQDAYADSISGQARKIGENTGYLVKSWNGVAAAAKWAWDQMLGIGRDATGSEQLDSLRRQLTIREQRGPMRPQDPASVAAFEAGNKSLRDQIALLDRLNAQQDQSAKKQTEQSEQLRNRTEWDRQGVEFLSKRQQREQALAKARVEGQALVNAGLITEKDLTDRLNAVREKFKDASAPKPKIARDAFEAEALREYTQALEVFDRIAASSAAKSDDLSKTQEELRKIQASPTWATYSRQQQEQVVFAASLAQAEEDRAAATTLGQQAIKDATQAMIEGQNARTQQVQSAEQAAAAAEREYEQYGLLKSQVQQLTLARLEDARAAAALGGEDVSDIEKRIAAQKRLIAATQGIEAKDAAKKSAEEAEKEWKRTADSIEQSLTDALLRGFESGKDFAGNLRDTIKNMFSTLVLRPVIQAVMSPITGALGGLGQSLGVPGLSSIAGLFGGGGGVPPNPFASGGGGGLSAIGNIAGLGSMFGAGGLGGSLAAGAGWLTGATTLGGSLTAGASLVGTGTMAGAMSGLGMMAGALGPLALGAIAIMALSKKRGGPKQDGWMGVGVEQGGDNSLLSSVQPVVAAYQAQFDQINQLLGGSNTAQFGLRVSRDPKGTAPTFVSSGAFVNGQFVRQDIDTNVGREDSDMQAAIERQMKQSLLAALKHSDLPGELGRFISGITDESQIDAAIARVQKALTERATLEARVFDLTHTELERLTASREKERKAIDETNRALFDYATKLEDLTTAAQSAAIAVDSARSTLEQAYSREADALRGVIERHTDYAQRLRAERDALTTESLTARQRRERLGSVFDATVTSSVAGNEQAIQDVGGVGRSLIEAVKASARTPLEVAMTVAKVQAGLTTVAAASEGRATTAQQQLDTMTQQLSALGVLNTTVLTVGDALAQYLDAINKQSAAQSAIQQAQLAYAVAQSAIVAPPPVVVAPAAAAASLPAGFSSQLQSFIAAGYTYESGGGDAGSTTVHTGFSSLQQLEQHLSSSGLLSSLSPEQRSVAMLEIASAFNRYYTLGHFANGGLARVGIVGERGIEAVDFETPGRVYTNEQTRGMFASNAELLPALRALLAELQALRHDTRIGDVAAANSLQKVERLVNQWNVEGMPPERTPA